jgi:hypothetical protein
MANPKADRDRVRLYALIALIAVLGVVLVVNLAGRGGGSAGGQAADRIAYESHDLPALESTDFDQIDAASVDFQRNPFIFGARPTPTPRPVTPLPTRPIVRRSPPATPTPRMARGIDGSVKPPPPPFDREFIGHFGPLQLQVAAFRIRGSDPDISEIQVATVGDVLDDIFIIREIGFESVVIGFVGYDRSEDTRVPLAEN